MLGRSSGGGGIDENDFDEEGAGGRGKSLSVSKRPSAKDIGGGGIIESVRDGGVDSGGPGIKDNLTWDDVFL